MKKLLAVATIGVVGYVVVKKLRERKNNEEVEVQEMENEEVVVENVEEEIVVDNDDEEAIEIEIVDNMEVEENNMLNKIKDLVKAPVKLVVKVCGLICRLLIKVNKKLKNVKDIDEKDLMYMSDFEFYVQQIGLIMGGLVIDINRKVILALAAICKMMNKIL